MNRTIKRVIFFVLLAIMIGGVLPWGLVRLGNIYFADSPAQARTVWTIAQFTSLYDRDVVYYDIGNSYYAERDFDAAADAYASADAVANPTNLCPIHYNWGLALRDKGDTTTDRDTARGVYSEALRVISLNVCQTDPAYKANFERLREELLARLKALSEQPEEEQSESGEDSQEAEETAKDDSTEKSASRDYQNMRRFYNNRDGSGSPGSYEFVW